MCCAGIEFRVTEEYDEDSPFSRPPAEPSVPPKDPVTAVPVPDADPAPSQTAHKGNNHGNGSSSAMSDALSQAIDITLDQPQSAPLPKAQAQARQPSHDGLGREQVGQALDTRSSLPTGIEVSIERDGGGHAANQVMDTVQQRPGVKRLLDGSGREAPSRSAQVPFQCMQQC